MVIGLYFYSRFAYPLSDRFIERAQGSRAVKARVELRTSPGRVAAGVMMENEGMGRQCVGTLRVDGPQVDWRGVLKRAAALIAVVASVITLSGCGYNSMQRGDEEIKSAWAEVLNQYQRRADLVPNLVSTVKGYASHEQKVFADVTEARAKVGQINVSPELLNDEASFQRFIQAQGQMTGALSRLLAVAENYPQLKADGAFRDLQAQLEGTENRITVARKRYIDSVKEYNITVRSFPTNLTAMIFGYSTKPTFTVENEAAIAAPPKVDFGN